MKKLLLLAAMCLAGLSAYAQGTVAFLNTGLADTYKLSLSTGGFISGAQYRIGLYAGPQGTAEGSLVMVGSTLNAAPAGAAGYFSGGNPFALPTDPRWATGNTITFQLRAWTAANGANYETAIGTGSGVAGKSTLGTVTLGGGTVQPGVLWTTSNPSGVTGFALTPVPEPSSIALGLLGLGAVALFRRKK